MYVLQADFKPAAVSIPENEYLSVSGLLLCLSSQDWRWWQELLRGMKKLTGLTTLSPMHALWFM